MRLACGGKRPLLTSVPKLLREVLFSKTYGDVVYFPGRFPINFLVLRVLCSMQSAGAFALA